MRESDLKKVLPLLGLNFEDFKKYMIGKTFQADKDDFYYYEQDVIYYFSLRLQLK